MLTSKVKCGAVQCQSMARPSDRVCVCVIQTRRWNCGRTVRLCVWATFLRALVYVPFCAAFDNTIFRSYLDAT